jgi:hypothetical protein
MKIEQMDAPPGLRRRALLLGAPAVLSACATPPSVDGTAIAPGRGHLAMQLWSNRPANLAFNVYGKQTFATRVTEGFLGAKGQVSFTGGERTVVLDVEAGDYMWTQLWDGYSQALLDGSRFQVRANAITYIGQIQLQLDRYKFGLRVVDREDDIRAYLREHYPQAMENLFFNKALAELRLKTA